MPGGMPGGGGPGGQAAMGGPSSQATTLRAKSVPELAMDLLGDDDNDRLFAARELRRQAVWADQRAGVGPIRNDGQLEARATLQDLRTDVFEHARRAVVTQPKVRGAMADLLGALKDPLALPELQAARAAETHPAVQKRLDRAIAALSSP
jgi:hypothetical protein